MKGRVLSWFVPIGEGRAGRGRTTFAAHDGECKARFSTPVRKPLLVALRALALVGIVGFAAPAAAATYPVYYRGTSGTSYNWTGTEKIWSKDSSATGTKIAWSNDKDAIVYFNTANVVANLTVGNVTCNYLYLSEGTQTFHDGTFTLTPSSEGHIVRNQKTSTFKNITFTSSDNTVYDFYNCASGASVTFDNCVFQKKIDLGYYAGITGFTYEFKNMIATFGSIEKCVDGTGMDTANFILNNSALNFTGDWALTRKKSDGTQTPFKAAISVTLGANNASEAALSIAGTLKTASGSTLTIDANGKGVGTYKILSAGTLTYPGYLTCSLKNGSTSLISGKTVTALATAQTATSGGKKYTLSSSGSKSVTLTIENTTCTVTLNGGTGVDKIYYRQGTSGDWTQYSAAFTVNPGTAVQYYSTPMTNYASDQTQSSPGSVPVNTDKTITLTAKLTGGDISGATVTVSPTSKTYTGSVIANPTVTVTLQGCDITSHCRCTWDDTLKNLGVYHLTVTARQDEPGYSFTGTATSHPTFTIKSANMPALQGKEWKHDVQSGSWSTGSNWNGGSAPSTTLGEFRDLDDKTTVNVDANATVKGIKFYNTAPLTMHITNKLTVSGTGNSHGDPWYDCDGTLAVGTSDSTGYKAAPVTMVIDGSANANAQIYLSPAQSMHALIFGKDSVAGSGNESRLKFVVPANGWTTMENAAIAVDITKSDSPTIMSTGAYFEVDATRMVPNQASYLFYALNGARIVTYSGDNPTHMAYTPLDAAQIQAWTKSDRFIIDTPENYRGVVSLDNDGSHDIAMKLTLVPATDIANAVVTLNKGAASYTGSAVEKPTLVSVTLDGVDITDQCYISGWKNAAGEEVNNLIAAGEYYPVVRAKLSSELYCGVVANPPAFRIVSAYYHKSGTTDWTTVSGWYMNEALTQAATAYPDNYDAGVFVYSSGSAVNAVTGGTTASRKVKLVSLKGGSGDSSLAAVYSTKLLAKLDEDSEVVSCETGVTALHDVRFEIDSGSASGATPSIEVKSGATLYADSMSAGNVKLELAAGSTLRLFQGLSSYEAGSGTASTFGAFSGGAAGQTTTMKVENNTATFSGASGVSGKLDLQLTPGANNTTANTMLTISGAFTVGSGSTLKVDASAKTTAGTYPLVRATSFGGMTAADLASAATVTTQPSGSKFAKVVATSDGKGLDLVVYNTVAKPTVTTSFTYDGNQKTAGSAATGYSVSGNKATNAGSYTFKAMLTSGYCWADDHSTADYSVGWQINKANDSVTKPTMAGWKYGESASSPSGSTCTSGTTITYKYYQSNGTTLIGTDRPSTPGTYVVKAHSAGNSNYNAGVSEGASFTISNGTISYTATGYSAAYDGSAHGISVTVTAPSSGATVKYGTTSGTYDKDTSPTRTNVGTTTVYYQITAANYTTVTGSQTINITRATATEPTVNTGLTYTGSSQSGVKTSGSGVTLGGTQSATNADSYSFTATPDSNHQWSGGGTSAKTYNWSIAKASISAVTLASTSITYDGSAHQPTVSKVTANGKDFTTATTGWDVTYSRKSDFSATTTDFTSAGTIYVKVTGKTNLKDSKTATYTIGKAAAPTITVTGYSGKYDGTAHNAVSVSGQKSGSTTHYSTDNSSWVTTMPTVKNVSDSKTIYVKVTNQNYNDATGNATATVSKRSVTLTSATSSKTYDGTALTAKTVTPSGDGFVSGEGATYSVTGTQTNAGSSSNAFTYTLNSGTTAGNYTITTTAGTLTVGKKTLTDAMVTITNASKTYNGSNQKPTVTVADGSPSILVSDDYTITNNGGTNVGKYSVTVTGKGNYTGTVTKSNCFTITAKGVTVTADAKSKTYGASDPTLTATVSGTLNSDTVTYTVSRAAGENVGTYTITPSGNATQGNYSVTYKTGDFTINKATLTATATISQNPIVYRDAAPTYSVTVTGFVNGETAATAAEYVAPEATCAYVQATSTTDREGGKAGEYPVTVTGGSAKNYKFVTTGATLTVNKKQLTTPVGHDVTYTGSQIDQPTSVSGMIWLVDASRTGTYQETNVGSYSLTLTPWADGCVWKDTGTAEPRTVNWSITPATLTVKANAKVASVTYGSAAPGYTLAYSGWKGSDGVSLITTAPTATTDYTTTTGAGGTYYYTPNGGNALANYSYSYQKGTGFTVARAKTATEPTVANRTYNGGSQYGYSNAGTYVTLSGTTAATEVNNYSFTATPDANHAWSNGSTSQKTYNWSISYGTYTITVAGGTSGTAGASNGYTASSSSQTFNMTTLPTRTGYHVKSFSSNVSGISATAAGSITINAKVFGNVTLTPTWEANTYTVTFEDKIGTGGMTSMTVTYGQPWPATVANIPSRAGYRFDGYGMAGLRFDTMTYSPSFYYGSDKNYCGAEASYGSDGDRTLLAYWTKIVDVPTGKTGLVYNGNEQCGVDATDDYAVSGNRQTAAGNYTASATLNQPVCDGSGVWPNNVYAFEWDDSDAPKDPKTVDWSIAKATPTLTAPTASAITYGKTLVDSALTGGSAKLNSTTVAGWFAWTNPSTKPEVKDSQSKGFSVTFTPTDTANFNPATIMVKLTVNKKQITIPTEKTGLTYTGLAQTGVNNPPSANLTTVSGDEPSQTAANTYHTTYSLKWPDNYEWSDGKTENKTVEWTIAKATLTVTATINGAANDSTSIAFGAAAPTYGVSYSGWKNSEGTSVLTKQATSTCPYVAGNTTSGKVGTYTVTPAGAEAANYTFSYVTHTFTVGKASVTIPKANNEHPVYDGERWRRVDNAPDETIAKRSSAIGQYGSGSVTFTLVDKTNYQWSDGSTTDKTVSWTVEQKTLTVKWGSTTSWVYDGNSHVPTCTLEGVCTRDTGTVDVCTPVVSGEQTNVGNYTATVTSLTGTQYRYYKLPDSGTTQAFSITKPVYTVNGDKQIEVDPTEMKKLFGHTVSSWQTALTTANANGVPGWEAYVLGMNSADEWQSLTKTMIIEQGAESTPAQEHPTFRMSDSAKLAAATQRLVTAGGQPGVSAVKYELVGKTPSGTYAAVSTSELGDDRGNPRSTPAFIYNLSKMNVDVRFFMIRRVYEFANQAQ